ncbi:MAG: protocatechuate 3,4-dioxygenase subunit alpha [Pseudomonadota bacterium]
MKRPGARLKETPSQTAGPFVHIGTAPDMAGLDRQGWSLGCDIAGPEARGERIRIEGMLFDGSGSPVRDAMIEVWQSNADGVYASGEQAAVVEPGFRGWGRAFTQFDSGEWSIDTVKPGPVPGPDGRMMAPHLALWIAARGINIGLHTRLYFDDEVDANEADPVLGLIEMRTRRDTLIARRVGDAPLYRFDIRLQGEGETVFFDV